MRHADGSGTPLTTSGINSNSSSSINDVHYKFHHPLVQQALYNLTPLSDRRKVRSAYKTIMLPSRLLTMEYEVC